MLRRSIRYLQISQGTSEYIPDTFGRLGVKKVYDFTYANSLLEFLVVIPIVIYISLPARRDV